MAVLVTGASGGIGAAIVSRLQSQGESVLAQDLNPDGHAGSDPIHRSTGDLTDRGYRRRILGESRNLGVDVAILAHGIEGAGSLHELEDARVREVVRINASSTIAIAEGLQPDLRRSGGVVVIVASQAGLRSEPNLAAYCASKFALVGWARRIAPLWSRQGVHVRVLCPGCTRTELLLDSFSRYAAAEGVSRDEALARRIRQIPIGRLAEPDEIAAAALYMAERSPRPRFLAATGGEVLL